MAAELYSLDRFTCYIRGHVAGCVARYVADVPFLRALFLGLCCKGMCKGMSHGMSKKYVAVHVPRYIATYVM